MLIKGSCPVWLWFLTAIIRTLQFSDWLKRFACKLLTRRGSSPSSTVIKCLKTAVSHGDVETFKKQVKKQTRLNEIDEALSVIRFGWLDDENVLDAILAMKNQRVAKQFWKAIVNNCQNFTIHELVSKAHLPRFHNHSEKLLMYVLISCEYIFTGTAAFFQAKDKYGNTILHNAAKDNEVLFRKLLKRLNYSAGCNLNIDFYFIFFLFNGLPTYYLAGVEGMHHTVCLLLQYFVYILYFHLGDFYIFSFLCQKNYSGETILDIASSKSYNGFKDMSQLIDLRSKMDMKSIFNTHYSTVNRDVLRTWRYRKGLIIFCAILGVLHQIQTAQTLLGEQSARSVRNVLYVVALAGLGKYEWLPQSLSILGFVVRTLTIIVHIPDRGWVLSIFLLGTDFLTNIFVLWIWRRLAVRMFKPTIQCEASPNKFYLFQARSDVVIGVLSGILCASPNLLIHTTFDVLKNTRNAYKIICDQEVRTKDDRRKIKNLLNQLSMNDEDLDTKVISDCSKVHVLLLPVSMERTDGKFEIEAVKSMCRIMGYTLHGPMDIGVPSDFEEFLEVTLEKIKKTAELVLIFIMSHGENDCLIPCSRSGQGIHIAQIINVIQGHTMPSTEIHLYVEACRRNGSQSQTAHDGDPVADVSQVPKALRLNNCRNPQRSHREGRQNNQLNQDVALRQAVAETINVHVHWATGPDDDAFQNSFITVTAGLLSRTKYPFINLHNVSINASKQCKRYYFATPIYSSNYLDSNVEIRVPQHLLI